ncbi:hypothetical protein pipiens_020116, partial [Culex pipiens pipiens]
SPAPSCPEPGWPHIASALFQLCPDEPDEASLSGHENRHPTKCPRVANDAPGPAAAIPAGSPKRPQERERSGLLPAGGARPREDGPWPAGPVQSQAGSGSGAGGEGSLAKECWTAGG